MACTNPGQPFDLNGRFGIFVQLYVDVSGLINRKDIEADLLLLADATQNGQQVMLGVQACDLVLPPIPIADAPPLTFQLDPALLASVGTVTSSGTIDGTGTCSNVKQPAPLILVLGAKLHDPQNDALPMFDSTAGSFTACGGTLGACTAASSPASGSCVCDQEGDGKPGATLGVMNAPAYPDLNKDYVALRTAVTLSGKVFSSDQIAGTVESSLEQTILGCQRGGNDCSMNDVGLVQGVSPLIEQSVCNPKTPYLSNFIGKRVPATTDCTALKAMKASLFGL